MGGVKQHGWALTTRGVKARLVDKTKHRRVIFDVLCPFVVAMGAADAVRHSVCKLVPSFAAAPNEVRLVGFLKATIIGITHTDCDIPD